MRSTVDRRIARALVAPLVVLVATACGGAKPADAPSASDNAPKPVAPVSKLIANPADVRIEMKGGRFSINGTALSDSPSLEDFEELFGHADRTSALVNRIHTYDRYGILVYEPMGAGGEGATPAVSAVCRSCSAHRISSSRRTRSSPVSSS